MADDSQEVADIIDALGPSPSPIDVYEATRDYDTRYIASAVGSAAQSDGGGSQPGSLRVVTLTVSFDTPGLLAGLTLYTPQVGDVLVGLFGTGASFGGVSNPAVWTNGGATLAFLHCVHGSFDYLDNIADLNAGADTPNGNDPDLTDSLLTFGVNTEVEILNSTTPFVVSVDDGSGGPNDATSGTATVYLAVISAP